MAFTLTSSDIASPLDFEDYSHFRIELKGCIIYVSYLFAKYLHDVVFTEERNGVSPSQRIKSFMESVVLENFELGEGDDISLFDWRIFWNPSFKDHSFQEVVDNYCYPNDTISLRSLANQLFDFEATGCNGNEDPEFLEIKPPFGEVTVSDDGQDVYIISNSFLDPTLLEVWIFDPSFTRDDGKGFIIGLSSNRSKLD